PQWLFGALAVVALGVAAGLLRRRGVSAHTSVAQRSAGWTLLVLSALTALHLVASDAEGGFVFLPILGLVLLVAMIALTLVFLRTPQMLPARLWEHITQWGMTVLGVATLFTMWLTGVAGWHVLAPAILILLLVQGARYVRWDLM